jgi:hypothetical protein
VDPRPVISRVVALALTLALVGAAPASARADRDATAPMATQVDLSSAVLASAAIGLLVFGAIALSVFGDRRHSRGQR